MRILLIALMLSGCTSMKPYAGVGVGYMNGDWDNGGEATTPFEVGLRLGISERAYADCGWEHFSQLTLGQPFNNRSESTAEFIGCRWRVYGDE